MSLDERTAKRLIRVLQQVEDTTKLEGVAIVNRDGLRVACAESAKVDVDTISTASAAIINTSETTAAQLGHGNVSEVIIKGDSGYLIITRVDDQHFMVASSRDIMRLGLNLGILKRYARSIAELLAQSKAKVAVPQTIITQPILPPPAVSREETVSDKEAIFEALRALGLEDAVTEVQVQSRKGEERTERI
ncbi:MAG: roadblock/LC7 domain-containing protein [Candidatus Jordarchaeales archaeon]